MQHLYTDTFNQMDINEVTCKSWISFDGTSLETIKQCVDTFITKLLEGLVKLQRHSFIAQQHSSFTSYSKCPLNADIVCKLALENKKYRHLHARIDDITCCCKGSHEPQRGVAGLQCKQMFAKFARNDCEKMIANLC